MIKYSYHYLFPYTLVRSWLMGYYGVLRPLEISKNYLLPRGWGQGGEMTQALYAHMNNKTI
jgi:hypothetical protein